jgi:hypothetical protein
MTLDRNAGPDRQARLTDTPDSGTAGFQMSRCPNCSAELGFEYCPRCGQRRIHPQDLSARHYFRELADEVATFHERFKTLRTLRKLLVPGLLSAEFLAGRRQPYLTPFKVYVVCAAMFFLAAPTAGFTLASMLEADQSGTLSRLVSARAADRGLAPPYRTGLKSVVSGPFFLGSLVGVGCRMADANVCLRAHVVADVEDARLHTKCLDDSNRRPPPSWTD